jgi:MFS family permease
VTANRAFTSFELRTFVYTASFGLSLPLLPLFYVLELDASDAWIGIIAGASNIGAMLGYIGTRQLARRRRGHLVLLPSLLAVALATALLAATGWLPAVPILAFVSGVAAAGAQLALFDAMMQRIPRELGVTFSSVDQSVQNFALVVSPSVAGVLAATLGLREALLVVAAVGFAALALFAVAERAPDRGERSPQG